MLARAQINDLMRTHRVAQRLRPQQILKGKKTILKIKAKLRKI